MKKKMAPLTEPMLVMLESLVNQGPTKVSQPLKNTAKALESRGLAKNDAGFCRVTKKGKDFLRKRNEGGFSCLEPECSRTTKDRSSPYCDAHRRENDLPENTAPRFKHVKHRNPDSFESST